VTFIQMVDYGVNILGVNGLVRVTSAQDADLALISKRGGDGWRVGEGTLPPVNYLLPNMKPDPLTLPPPMFHCCQVPTKIVDMENKNNIYFLKVDGNEKRGGSGRRQ
jgi:hypothetical protein